MLVLDNKAKLFKPIRFVLEAVGGQLKGNISCNLIRIEPDKIWATNGHILHSITPLGELCFTSYLGIEPGGYVVERNTIKRIILVKQEELKDTGLEWARVERAIPTEIKLYLRQHAKDFVGVERGVNKSRLIAIVNRSLPNNACVNINFIKSIADGPCDIYSTKDFRDVYRIIGPVILTREIADLCKLQAVIMPINI
jgi:hypothetical protein